MTLIVVMYIFCYLFKLVLSVGSQGSTNNQITPLALNREVKLHYIVMLFMLFVVTVYDMLMYCYIYTNVSCKTIFMPSFYFVHDNKEIQSIQFNK